MKELDHSFGGVTMGSDYSEGAHPAVLEELIRTNRESSPGYGSDPYTARAAALIRQACSSPEAGVYFFVGGTQVNAVTLGALLKPWEGVVAAETAHISIHEAGAVELGGHKVICLKAHDGKIDARDLERICETYYEDETRDHIVTPGAVYLSQPTEYGTLYSLAELRSFRTLCDRFGLSLYVDGARLAYALACPENDVSLPDLASLCDAFYIGGNKCGALFGEALVVPDPSRLPRFFSVMKQHGAVLSKGRLLGVQFSRLFKDGLYEEIGRTANATAAFLRGELKKKGYTLAVNAPTNQVFVRVTAEQFARLNEEHLGGFWSHEEDGSYIVRFVASWATTRQDTGRILSVL